MLINLWLRCRHFLCLKARLRNKKKDRGLPKASFPRSSPKNDRFDEGEVVKIEIDESLFNNWSGDYFPVMSFPKLDMFLFS